VVYIRPWLGALAVLRGYVTPLQLERALQRQAHVPDRPIGRILMDMGVLGTADLEHLLRLQADIRAGVVPEDLKVYVQRDDE